MLSLFTKRLRGKMIILPLGQFFNRNPLESSYAHEGPMYTSFYTTFWGTMDQQQHLHSQHTFCIEIEKRET